MQDIQTSGPRIDLAPPSHFGTEGGEEVRLEELDARQRAAYDAVFRGENVFITGGAGTGKTMTVRAVVQALQQKYGDDFPERVAVTGATGTAANLAGGCTLHSATGVRVPQLTKDFKRVGQGLYKHIWGSMVDVLLIDEASMISGEFFDLLEEQVRRVRANDRPFGGIQVILVGDVFQLPPIPTKLPPEVMSKVDQEGLKRGRVLVPTPKNRSKQEYFMNRGMIFQSDAFWDLNFTTIELEVPHRQRNDTILANILSTLRLGPDKEKITELNMACYRPMRPPTLASAGVDGEDNVFLVPTISQSDERNAKRLSEIPGASSTFPARDSVEVIAEPPENLTAEDRTEFIRGCEEVLWGSGFFDEGKSGCPAAKDVELKIQALVILSATIDARNGLVNGRTGRVVSLRPLKVQFRGVRQPVTVQQHQFTSRIPGLGSCVRRQVPLRLAWAITHHRSQGKTLPGVIVDPKSFANGQAYVALSRSPSLESLQLMNAVHEKDFKVNKDCVVFMKLLAEDVPPAKIRQAVGHWRGQALPAMGPPGSSEIVSFGKHRGKTFAELAQIRSYVHWAKGIHAPNGGLRRFINYLEGCADGGN